MDIVHNAYSSVYGKVKLLGGWSVCRYFLMEVYVVTRELGITAPSSFSAGGLCSGGMIVEKKQVCGSNI